MQTCVRMVLDIQMILSSDPLDLHTYDRNSI